MGKKCLSLETACLFGACAFTLDVLVRLWELSFNIILICFNWSKYGNLIVRAQVISAFFAAVYCTFSLILAFFLFKGIFKKLSGVIKLGAIFVLVLRLWECAGSLVSWEDVGAGVGSSAVGSGGGPQIRDEFGVYRMAKIGRFIVINLSAALFVTVLFLYNRKLLPPRSHHHKNNNKTSRNSTSTLSI